MKLRYAIAAALVFACASNAHAYDLLNDWPTKIKTDDGYEFGIKGLYQFDSDNFSGDTTNPVNGALLLDDSATWRRKEFNVYGKAPWGVDFNFGYDFTIFAKTKAGWIDNFVRYTNKDIGEFRVGQFKTPVGWEEASSSAATTFLERALPVQATNPGRRIGADWLYQGIPHWLINVAYFNGGDLNGDNDGKGPAVHIVYNPILDKTEVIHIGFAASEEDRDRVVDGRGVVTNPAARFRARPEANLTTSRLVDTGNLLLDGNIDRMGLEGAWIHGPLLVQGEYLRFNANRLNNPDYSGDGFYVFGSWMLTGESRAYAKGAVGNVKPVGPYGAFEVAIRYSELNLNDGAVFGGKEHDWTLGANWYLGSHLKLQANYIHAQSTKRNTTLGRDIDIDPNVVALRAQVYF